MKCAVASDFHLLPGQTLHDARHIRRFARECVVREVAMAVLSGDIIDVTRGADVDEAARILVALLDALVQAGIPIKYLLGNHDYVHGDTGRLARALYQAFTDAKAGAFTVSTGPELWGPWIIEHGNRFDPWCQTPENLGTVIGNTFTLLDGWLGKVGLDLEPFDLTKPATPPLHPALDWPLHQAANRWCLVYSQQLCFGHSHLHYDLGGPTWRALNVGALMLGRPCTFGLLEEDGSGLLVRVDDSEEPH